MVGGPLASLSWLFLSCQPFAGNHTAHLPPAGPSPVLRSIRILEIDMAIQSPFCAASNACR